MATQDIRFRLGLDGVSQVSQGAAQAAQGLAQLGTAAGQAQRSTALTGNQTAQLSAQLQDLFVQIQAGGNPLTALIQQGSQLSAVFGGVGNAVRAVGSLITPAVAAIGGLAAGVGVLALAYKKASDETDAYNKAIILTGNAAGVTAGQLGALARAVSSQVGSQGKAAESLTQLAGSGRVAAGQLALLTEASVRFERVGGDAAENTNKKFAELGRTPLQALAKLNEAEGFLTATLYNQVKALEDQGRTTEAAAAAQQGYAAIVIDRSAQIEAKLGTLQRGWNAVGDAAKWAWDRMQNIGRPDTIDQEIEKTEGRIRTLQKTIQLEASWGRAPSKRDTRDLADAQALLETQREGLRLDRQRSERQAGAVLQGQNLVEAGKLMEGTLSNQLKLEKEIAQARLTMEIAGKSPEEIERTIDYIKATSAAGQQAFAVMVTQINGAVAVAAGKLQAAQIDLESSMQRGLVSQRRYIEESAAIEKQALSDQLKALEQVRARTAAQPNSGPAVAQLDVQIAEKRIEIGNRELKLRNDLIPVILRENAAVVSSAEAFRKEEQAADPKIIEDMRKGRVDLVRQIQAQSQALDDAAEYQQAELQLMYATDAQRAVTLEQLRIEIARRQEIKRLQSVGASQDEIDLANQNAARAKAAAVAKIYADEFASTAQQINKTLGEAITDALMGDGASAGKALRRELIRIFSQPLQVAIQGVMQPVSNALASWALGGQQGASGAAGGANGLSSLGSLYSMGKSAWSWLGGSSAGASTAAAGAGAFVDAAGYGAATNAALAEYGITSGGTAAAGAGAAGAGASSAAAAIPIIGWIVAAIMASDAAYKGGNSVDMLDTDAKKYGVGAFETHKYKTLSKLGFSDKWANILSGAPLTARLFGHKASSSGYGIGSVSQGDFISDNITPFQYGDNTLGTGRSQDLEGLSSDILAAVGIAAGNFGGKLQNGLRVGSFTDRDREGKVAALLGYFGSQNTLIAGTQTGTGAFGIGGPKAGGQKIDAADFESWVSEQMPLLIIQGLKQSDLDTRFKDYFDSIDLGSMDPTKAADQAKTLLDTATNVAKITEAFKPLGGALGQLNTISVQSVADLAKAAGGFDALGQSTSAYYQAFYSDSERAAASTKGVSDALAKVGLTLPDLSKGADAARGSWRAMLDAQDLTTQSGREAAAALLGLSGSFDQLAGYIDGLQQSVKAFKVSGFLGEDATLANQKQQLTEGFAAIGQAVPKTRAEFGALVDTLAAGGVATASMLNAVLGMVDGFDAVATAAEAAAKAQQDAAKEQQDAADRARQQMASVWSSLAQQLVQSVSSAYQEVQQQIDAASQQARTDADTKTQKIQADSDQAISKLESQASDIQREFASLQSSVDDNIRKLQGDLAGDGGRDSALKDLRNSLPALQSGGTVDFDRIRAAASTASNIDPSKFASRLDFQREQSRTVQLLRDVGTSGKQGMTQLLGGIAAQQVAIESASDEQIKAIEKARDEQLAALQNQLREAQGIAGTLININKGVGSVAEAIAALRTASTAANANVNTWVKTGGQEVWASSGGAVATRPENSPPQAIGSAMIQGRTSSFSVSEAQSWVKDRLNAGDLIGIYARAVAEGIDSRSLDALMGWAPGTSLSEALKLGLPAFATGTASVSTTGLAVVHQDERIITATDNAALMRMLSDYHSSGGAGGDSATRDELAALRSDMMSALHVIAANTRKAAQALDDSANGGNPLTVATA